MYSYEQILEQINTKCQLNHASAFEFPLLLPIYWAKKYHAKKGLFSYHWKYIESEEKKCSEFERVLSKLPKGISYKKLTTITMPLPDKAAPDQTVYEQYSTTYTILVSAAYLQKFAHTTRNS